LTGKTHQILGIGVGLVTFLSLAEPNYSPATLAAVLVFSSLGSLLPDLDKASAEFWHSIPVVGHSAGKIVDPFISHRNITHSIIGTALAAALFYFVLKSFPDYWGINTLTVFISAMSAYISHLLADSFTVQGIPLFWPAKWKFGIPPKPFDGIRIVTGKWFENLIIFPIVNIALILLIVSRWSTIKLMLFK
jgi:membrane-bound metal-dependent hydrolase YbcI (DUF457 family)